MHKRITSPNKANNKPASGIPDFDALPDSALVRISQLCRNPKKPNCATLLPFSPATFWRKVAAKDFPAPIKLGARLTCWRVGDVRAWLATQQAVSRSEGGQHA